MALPVGPPSPTKMHTYAKQPAPPTKMHTHAKQPAPPTKMHKHAKQPAPQRCAWPTAWSCSCPANGLTPRARLQSSLSPRTYLLNLRTHLLSLRTYLLSLRRHVQG